MWLALAPAFAVSAATAVSVRGGAHTGYDRMVFDLPRKTTYDVKQDGSAVTITFKADATFTPDASARKLQRVGSFISANPVADETQVSFTIPAKGSIKHFLSGSSLVIDVKGEGKPVAVPAPAPVAPAPAVAETPAAPAATPAVQEMPKAEEPASPPPAPANEPMANVPAFTPMPAEPAVPQISAPVANEVAPAPDAAPSPPPVEQAAPTPTPASNLSATPTLLAQFDPKLSIPAAVYARGDYVYIAFDRRLRFDIHNLFPTFNQTPAEEIPVTAFSAYRVPMPLGAEAFLSKTDSRWQIDVAAPGSGTQTMLGRDLEPRPDPLYSFGARVIVPLLGAGQILSFTDPVGGDTLYLVPAATPGDRVLRAKRFADFELLPTLQGLVVRALNDQLRVRMIEEGVEITVPQGLNITIDTIDAKKKKTVAPGQHGREELIPLSRWRQTALGDFTETRQALQARITEAEPNLRDRARIELARFYLSFAEGNEALGILAVVAKSNPDIVGRPEFQLLRGLGALLANDADSGLKALEASGNGDRDEIRLWRAFGLAQQRRWTEANADFAATMPLLENYPSPFAERFAELAAETFIAVNDSKNAARMIDLMVARSSTRVLREPAILYLRGVMAAQSSAFDQARDLWKQAAGSDDYLSRVRAELALVDLEISSGNMTIQDAVRKLEGLRFAWRGDELEMDMLNRLADYQMKANQPTEAMETLERAKVIFPDSNHEDDLLAKQRVIFQDVFLNSNIIDQQTPLQTLAMYEKYKGFSPTDAAQRQQIISSIVDKMMAIDLLPQAIELLTPEVDKAANDEDKAKITLRLAALHLLNGEPATAAKVLKKLDGMKLSSDNAQQEKLLTARALSDQDQNTDALQLLAGDTSADAMRLASTAAWRAKDWVRAAEALAYIAPPTDRALDADGAQLVIARAVALSLAGNEEALKKLYADYQPAMAQTDQAQTFAILANEQVVGGAASLKRIQEQTSDVDLFQKFLDTYKKSR